MADEEKDAFDSRVWHEVDRHGTGDETVIIRIDDVIIVWSNQRKKHDAPF